MDSNNPSVLSPRLSERGAINDLYRMDIANGFSRRIVLWYRWRVPDPAQNGDDGRCYQSYCAAWDRNGFYRHKRIKRTSYADRCDYCRFADSRPRSMVSFRGVQQDASIGVVFTTLFAIGVILIATQVGNAHLDTKHALMGEITFVPWDVMHVPLLGEVPKATFMLAAVLLVVLIVILAFYKEWKITSFDPALAASIGIPVVLMHYVFMSLVSITTVASFDAVGAIMVVAMLITPAAAAYLWTDKLSIMLVLSGAFGVISAFLGYYVALWLDTSISGSMAFATGIVFILSFLFSRDMACSPAIFINLIRMAVKRNWTVYPEIRMLHEAWAMRCPGFFCLPKPGVWYNQELMPCSEEGYFKGGSTYADRVNKTADPGF